MLFFSQTSLQSKQFTRASLIAKSPTSNPPALKKNSLASTFNEYRTGYPFQCKVSTLSFCVSFNNRVWEWITNCITSHGHFRVPKTLTFKMRPSAQLFLWKWVLFAWEWKIISISKAEHLTSFWYRGPRELGNGLFNNGLSSHKPRVVEHLYR